jgi:K+-transporting ATPase ATPase A chain
MSLFLVVAVAISLWAETLPHPGLGDAAVMEGEEVRMGVTSSVLWANATTLASNGSVNAMHSSLSPLSGGVALFNMLLGEIIFGGVRSGLYGMVAMIIVTVFLAGLMVGRTPEYLGKRLGAFEVKMCAIAVITPSIAVLAGCAVSFLTEGGRSAVGHGGPHALSEVLYAWTSMSNNNGSAFGSLNATGPLYTYGGALAMLVGRLAVILPLLAMAGSLASMRRAAPTSGTLPTEGIVFAVLLALAILILAALTHFVPLALGPILEHLLLSSGKLF